MDDFDERAEELSTLQAIYPELELDELDPYSARLELAISPTKPLLVRFVPSGSEADRAGTYVEAAKSGAAYIEHDVELSHLPPLTLHVALPFDYPVEKPPQTRLVTQQDWLPKMKVRELERQVEVLWEEYGHCQILFAYIDYIQQAAEQSFNLDRSAEGCLVLPSSAQNGLVAFDSATKEGVFSASTFDCGICLEPKKGSSCYRMEKCGHVFCRQCLQDFYNNAITEGDVTGVKCLDPTCGKEATSTRKRKRKGERTLHPRELLLMGIDEAMVRRYVEMKRKKRLEADKETVWCPRTWCQGPAKTKKYPPIPSDLSAYIDGEPSDSDDSGVEEPSQTADEPLKNPKNVPPDPTDRLAVCEKCSLAFCKVCFMGWHGPFARCYPRNPAELSAEEKASYDYIRLHTSPCPYCSSPTQKTMGCNHMKCFQCSSHFCYLCGSWLDAQNPYQHFNKAGSPCYQRLWELEEGDEGQHPGDGRGFAGGRGWEQIAIEAAREAEAQEAAAAAQAEEDERAVLAIADQEIIDAHEVEIAIAMAQVHIVDNEEAPPPRAAQQRRGAAPRRARNAFPTRPPPANGAANAVRNYERNNRPAARGRGGAPRPIDRLVDAPLEAEAVEERQRQELQRFLALAGRDEEDGWDSDELGDDDEGFVIR